MRPNAVKQSLKAGKPAIGTWLSLASITAARFVARSGLDWLTVDIEHSLCDWETAAHIFGTVSDAGCGAFARVPANRHDHIKRVLDNGAQGVVVPMVNTRKEAQDAITAMLYPPRGTRSVGGNVHALNFQATPNDYFAHADDEILKILQCEHIKAVEDADAIFSVPGIDVIFVGPNDLAASMKSNDGKPASMAATNEALSHILKTCRKHGVAPGYHCMNAEEAVLRLSEGWQFLAIGSELKFMLNGTAEVLKRVRGSSQVSETAKY